MNDDEVQRLLDDHYAGESQTLTTGAEQNLLKLAELRGRMTDQQKERWAEIKRGFGRRQATGGSDDPIMRTTSVLGKVSENLDQISGSIVQASQRDHGPLLVKLSDA